MGSNNLDTNLIKKANKKIAYTHEQITHLNNCTDPVGGPLYFMKQFVHIQHPLKGDVKFQPYLFQEDLVNIYHNYRYSICLVARQTGKTTVAAAYLLWYAMFIENSTILIAAHKFTGTQEIMERVRYIYESLPDYIKAGVREYNKQSIKFDNGSRIVAQTTTINTGRGMSVSLVYLDEFAFVEPRIAKEFWTALSPTLSTGGKCLITSTPNSDEDQFAELWFEAIKTTDDYGNEKEVGRNGFKGYKATWEAHPERTQDWAEQEKSKIGLERFLREHACEFIVFEETLINSVKLSNIQGIHPIKKTGEVRWYKEIEPHLSYVVSLDPSMGTGGDYAAIEVLEMPTLKQVAEWQHNKSPVEQQVKIMKQILDEIYSKGQPEIYWSLEANTLGEAPLAIIREIGEDYFPGVMLHDPKKEGHNKIKRAFWTTNKSKIEACSKLKYLIESGKLQIYSKNLISELKTFVASGNTYCGKQGCTDDLVSALLLLVRMINCMAAWDDASRESLSTDVENDGYDAPLPISLI